MVVNKLIQNYKRIDFQLLLVALLLVLATPMLYDLGLFNQKASQFTWLVLILSANSVVTIHQSKKILGRLLGFLALVMAIAQFFGEGSLISMMVYRTVLVCFMIYVTIVLVRQVLKEADVNERVMVNVISGYLLLGLTFSVTVLGLSTLDPAAYSVPFVSSTRLTYDFIYYGFMTVNTVGYGDILPVSQTAKSLATIGSTFGLLYLALVMAIIVSKYVSKK